MKSSVALPIAILACVLLNIHAASLHGPDGENYQGLAPGPHLVGAKQLNKYNRHTYAIRFQFSRNLGQLKDFKYCTGVRLSGDWILTAAECLQIPSHNYVRITSPDHYDFNDMYYEIGDTYITHPLLKYEIHGAYDVKTKSNNLALIKSEFIFLPDVSSAPELPYSLREDPNTYEGQTAVVSSYEITLKQSAEDEEKIVTALNLTVVATSECEALFVPFSKKGDFLCASAAPGQGLTQDDIGSPLVHREAKTNRKTLLGIASTVGPRSADKPQRVLFTKIQPHVNWISFWTHLPIPSRDDYLN